MQVKRKIKLKDTRTMLKFNVYNLTKSTIDNINYYSFKIYLEYPGGLDSKKLDKVVNMEAKNLIDLKYKIKNVIVYINSNWLSFSSGW